MTQTKQDESVFEKNTTAPVNGNAPILLGQKKEKGRRPNIEDFMDVKPLQSKGGLVLTVGLVADGIGGENHGEVAAETTIKETFNFITESPASSAQEIPELLKDALAHANDVVFQMGRKNKELRGMGCTAALVAIHDSKLYMANVGDSRVYLYRDEKLRQLTVDHTWAHDMVENGVLKKEDALKHPKAEELARSIGYEAKINVDLSIYIDEGAPTKQGMVLRPGDRLLLCSDGLIKPRHDNAQLAYVTDEEIERILSARPADEAAGALVDKAIGRNADDNVTAVVMEMPGASYNKLAALPPWLLPAGIGGAVALLLLIAAIVVLPSLFGGSDDMPPPASVAETGNNEADPNVVVSAGQERTDPTNTPLPPADLSDDVKVYGADYEVGANNNITLQEGQLVVESQGSTVTVANPYGEKARLLGAGVMGISYTLEPLTFDVHCFVGECYVEGSVEGEQPLQANEAVTVGASGKPGDVFATRNDEFVSVAAVVPVPTATLEPTATNTPEPTPTARPTRQAPPPSPLATAVPIQEPTQIAPVDSDEDGVPDNEDNCPITAGNAEDNPGCPFSKEQTESGVGGESENNEESNCTISEITGECE